jgi:hypothetical protein
MVYVYLLCAVETAVVLGLAFFSTFWAIQDEMWRQKHPWKALERIWPTEVHYRQYFAQGFSIGLFISPALVTGGIESFNFKITTALCFTFLLCTLWLSTAQATRNFRILENGGRNPEGYILSLTSTSLAVMNLGIFVAWDGYGYTLWLFCLLLIDLFTGTALSVQYMSYALEFLNSDSTISGGQLVFYKAAVRPIFYSMYLIAKFFGLIAFLTCGLFVSSRNLHNQFWRYGAPIIVLSWNVCDFLIIKRNRPPCKKGTYFGDMRRSFFTRMYKRHFERFHLHTAADAEKARSMMSMSDLASEATKSTAELLPGGADRDADGVQEVGALHKSASVKGTGLGLDRATSLEEAQMYQSMSDLIGPAKSEKEEKSRAGSSSSSSGGKTVEHAHLAMNPFEFA